MAGHDGTPRAAELRDSATLATTVLAAQAGAWGVRVHDAAGSVDAIRTVEAVRRARAGERVGG
jgi:dihydropteroate synthase